MTRAAFLTLAVTLSMALLTIVHAPRTMAAEPVTPDQATVSSEDLRAGCNHYVNRARFMSREGRIEFVVLVSEMCQAAERSMTHPSPAQRVAAEALLNRVLELRNTIIAMNMRRVYGDQTSPWAKPLTRDGRLMPVGRVSPAGEFLIAHRMGVMTVYDAWLDTGGRVSLAFVR